MLEVRSLDVYYGAVHALKGVSLDASAGEVVTLIGANGAGKTTLLRAISGLVRPRAGTIRFEGKDLTKLPPEEIVGLGLSHAPEGRRVFANLSVADNLDLGAYRRRDRSAIASDLQSVWQLFPRLLERRKQLAGTLSGGEQQMLAIGRGLMGEPRLLILDEPSLGLSPLLVEELFGLIRSIHAQGVALLLVEQNVVQSLEVAQRAYILDNGRFVLEGSADQIRDDPALKRAYLGM